MDLKNRMFPKKYLFVPNTTEIFEWELALLEMNSLTADELIERSAFFSHIDGHMTVHYQLCSFNDVSVHNDKSIATQSFFKARQFSTGYATHGLFPYRGKFHPQLVKAIINIIGLKTGDVLLDPMCGSGTACIEARLMGIDSIGIDVSPFCVLMSNAKSVAMEIDPGVLKALVPDPGTFVDFMARPSTPRQLITAMEKKLSKLTGKPDEKKAAQVAELILLMYLDTMGYARRSTGKTIKDLFPYVSNRYITTIDNFRKAASILKCRFGSAEFKCASALRPPLPDASVDGVITSPPYSFAIDYADNDRPQLEFLGDDVESLKANMVGPRGRTKRQKIEQYFQDMNTAILEMYRVLKSGKMCVIVIGSNDIQTGGIRHEEEMKRFAKDVGFKLRKEMIKPIKGIQNTMHEEFILFFQKGE